MALVAIVLTGCKEQNTPSNNGGKDAFVDFTYQQTGPLLFSFTNTSNGIDSYKWDFGDGTWAYGKDAMHQYESIGTYTVTLTGTSGNLKYDCRKKITVKKPLSILRGTHYIKSHMKTNIIKWFAKMMICLPPIGDLQPTILRF